MGISDMLKKEFEHWEVVFESDYPPSDRVAVRKWGWYMAFKHPVKGSRVEFRLHDAKYVFGTNFPREYMVEVIYFPYGYEREDIRYREVVYGDTLEGVFSKALEAWRTRIPKEEKKPKYAKQTYLKDFLYALIPLSLIVGLRFKAEQ